MISLIISKLLSDSRQMRGGISHNRAGIPASGPEPDR